MSNPLWLPKGSVRALIAFALIAVVSLTLFVPVVEGASDTITALIALAGIAIRDYFASRSNSDNAE